MNKFRLDFGLKLADDKNAYMFTDLVELDDPLNYSKAVLRESTPDLKLDCKLETDKYDCYIFNSKSNAFWVKIRKAKRK